MAKPNITAILAALHGAYPGAKYELNWSNPHELLVATILAAQCTDERVNRVTATLFKKYTSAQAYLDVAVAELEEDLRPTGFYKNKTKAVRGACALLVERFGGEVPKTMAELTTLPGVARKTANVVLTNAFGTPSGIIVDTHVARVSRRMGLSARDGADDIERDLMRIVPKDQWIFFGPAVVLHGRYTCVARAPKCAGCVLREHCERRGVDQSA